MTDTPSETKRQASFTEGPWQTITQGYGRWYIFPAPNGELIAAVDSVGNARLIAAAPELYKALEVVGEHLAATALNEESAARLRPAVLSFVRATLRKADTGKG